MLNLFFSKKTTGILTSFLLAAAVTQLTGCGSGGPGAAGTPTTAASFALLATPSTVNSDALNSTTIKVVALNAANAAISGVVATLSADSGILSDPTITTGTGATPVTVTFTPDASKINRTATITVTAGGVSSQIPVQIIGSTVTVSSTGATLPDDGLSPVTLTITAKDSGGIVVPGAAVALTQTGSGSVTLSQTSGTTNASGQLTVVARGAGTGVATISVAALGATATTALTVSPTAATFAIDQLNGVDALNTSVSAMKIGNTLTVRVNSLTAANVTFATTEGAWNGGTSSVVTVPAVAGKATANLTTTQAGIATIQVYDAAAPATSDSLTVAMTSITAASITIQPSPSVVSKSVGTTTGSSTLIAMVRDVNGFPVGDAPVAFSIVNPTGGGESVSPVVVLSASTTTGGLSLGEARTSFTSGSTSSGANGVHVRASVVDTNVKTEAFDPVTLLPVNLTSSGNDATLIIGGTSGSVAFGTATVIGTDTSNSNYIREMSVMVTDSNGNPAPKGTVVNLSVWPLTFSTGSACARDADSVATNGTPAIAAVPAGLGTPAVAAVAAVAATGASGFAGDLTITASAASGAAANGYRVTIVVNAGSFLNLPAGAGSAITTVTGSTTLASAAAFVGVVPGMVVAGTNIPAGTTVVAVASTSNLTLSQAATAPGSIDGAAIFSLAPVVTNPTATTATVTITSPTPALTGTTWSQVAAALNANATFFASKTASTANGGAFVVDTDAQTITLAGGVTAVAAIAATAGAPAVAAVAAVPAGPARGTFYNEDINENLILDAGEDGRRIWVASGAVGLGTTKDGYATPPNAAAGSVPATVLTDTPAAGTVPTTVVTDATGVAAFNLTYPKKSAIWITDRIRARTVVQGTEMVGEIKLFLDATIPDAVPCKLPDSPYFY